MHKVIANTTPLIALANIDRLELLREVYGTGYSSEIPSKDMCLRKLENEYDVT